MVASVDHGQGAHPPSSTHRHALVVTHALSPTHIHSRASTNARSPTDVHSRTFTNARSPTDVHPQTFTHARTPTPVHPHTFTHARSPTHVHPQTFTHARSPTPVHQHSFTNTRRESSIADILYLDRLGIDDRNGARALTLIMGRGRSGGRVELRRASTLGIRLKRLRGPPISSVNLQRTLRGDLSNAYTPNTNPK